MVSRLGSVELGNIVQYKLYQYGFTHELDKTQLKSLVFNAGFFPAPNKTELERFVSTYCDSFRYVDVLGIWGNLGEDYMITQYGKKDIVLSSLGRFGTLERCRYTVECWAKGEESSIHPSI